MAARGSTAKETIKNKILEVFDGSFLYDGNKEIRIPIMENGEKLEIKCVLTCAKTNVGGDAVTGITTATKDSPTPQPAKSDFMNEPSAEEKQAVADLCQKLGLV